MKGATPQFYIRRGLVNAIGFPDYDILLIVDWRITPTRSFPWIRMISPPQEIDFSLVGNSKTEYAHGVLIYHSIDQFARGRIWQNYIRKLRAFGLSSAIAYAARIILELKEIENQVQEKLQAA